MYKRNTKPYLSDLTEFKRPKDKWDCEKNRGEGIDWLQMAH
jgi:hypothetical protein